MKNCFSESIVSLKDFIIIMLMSLKVYVEIVRRRVIVRCLFEDVRDDVKRR